MESKGVAATSLSGGLSPCSREKVFRKEETRVPSLKSVGRDYSTSDDKRNHSPLMKKRPESRHPVGGRRSSELSRDQRGGPSQAESHLVCLLYLISRKTTLS